jgi:hypothetical protein
MVSKINDAEYEKIDDELLPQALLYHIATRSNTQHLIELYYWSQEEHLVELMRAFIRLPDETKSALASYLRLGIEKSDLVRTTIGDKGELIISSPQVCHELQKQCEAIDSHQTRDVKH